MNGTDFGAANWHEEINSPATDRVLAVNNSALITVMVGFDAPSIMLRRVDGQALELVRRYRVPGIPVGLWHPDTLEGLGELDPEIDSVVITSGATFPVESLYGLPTTVKKLAIYGPAFGAKSFDPARLPGVIDLTLSFDLLDPSRPWPEWLEAVDFVDGSPSSIEELPASEALRSLALSGLNSLGGLERFPQLRRLSLARCRKLADLIPLDRVPKLEFLEINGARGLPELDPVARLCLLAQLWILDCGPIASLKPLKNHPALVELLAYGSTDVQDGDLTPLLTMPELRRLVLASRRKYRPSVASVVRERALLAE